MTKPETLTIRRRYFDWHLKRLMRKLERRKEINLGNYRLELTFDPKSIIWRSGKYEIEGRVKNLKVVWRRETDNRASQRNLWRKGGERNAHQIRLRKG